MEKKHSIKKLLSLMSENWPNTTTVESEIALGVMRLNDLILVSTKSILSRFELTQAAFEVLTTLRAFPEPRQLSPTELYRAILISSGGMTKVLKDLEDKGWVERIDHGEDKRSKLVKLTKKGAQMAEKAMAAVMAGDREVLSGLTPTERGALANSLLMTLSKVEMD